MPIGTGIVYNTGDLILSQVSSSGTAFLETKIAAATSSLIYFDSTARINSASLNSITVGTASYVSGSNSIVTNFTASNISASGTSSFGYVGIGTTSPIYKLDLQPTSSTMRVGQSLLGAFPANPSTFSFFGHTNLDNLNTAANYALLQESNGNTYLNASSGKNIYFRIANSDKMILNSTGQFGIGTTSPITGYLDVRSNQTKSVAGPTNIAFFGSGDGGNPLGLVINHESSSGIKMVGLVGTEYGSSGNNIKINETLHVQYSGNVGIGTISPASLLSVQGDINSNYNSSGTSRVWRTFATNHASGNRGAIVLFGMYDGSPAGMNVVNTSSSNASYNSQYLTFLTHEGAVSADERMRITPLGNVGIGTTNPSYLLDVYGSIRSKANTATGTILLGETSGGTSYVAAALIGTPSPAYNPVGKLSIQIPTHGVGTDYGLTEQMSIQVTGADTKSGTIILLPNSGYVGIGTTSPAYLLDVSGSTRHGYRTSDNHYFTGSVNISGSLNATSSWAINSLTASRANSLNAANSYTVDGLTANYVEVVGLATIPTTGIYRPATKSLGLSADGTLIFKISNAASPATSSIETGNFIVQSGNVGIGTNVIKSNSVLTVNGAGNFGTSAYGFYVGTDGTGTYLDAGSQLIRMFAGSTERLRIQSDGNVGIGTTSASYKLDVLGDLRISGSSSTVGTFKSSASACFISLIDSSGNNVFLGNDDGDLLIQTPTSAYSTKVIVKNDGSVGIGTTSPAGKLHIVQNNDVGRYSYFGSNSGLFIKANDNSINNLLVLENTEPAANYGVSINFNLGYGGNQTTAGTAIQGSKIVAAQEQTWTSTASTQDAFLAFYTALNGTSGEKVRITSDGNVGIGTTSPAYKLEVASGTSGQQSLVNFRTADSTTANNAGIQIFATPSATATSREAVMALDADGANASGGDYFLIKKRGNSGTTDFEQYSNASMRFGTNFISRATYDMTIANDGNVGIGTTSPIAKLDIRPTTDGDAGISIGTGGSISGTIVSPANLFINANTGNAQSGAGQIAFGFQRTGFTGGSEVMRITEAGGGNVGIGTTSPVAKLQVEGNISGSSFTSSISNAVGFLGTASWAQNVVSASYATTAQTANALNASNTYTVAGLTSAYVDVTGAGTIPTTGIYRPSSKTLGLSADATLILKINGSVSPYVTSIESGNLGIGTSSPSSKLEVAGDFTTLKDGADTIQRQIYIANAINNRAFNFQLNSGGTGLDLWSYNSSNAWLKHTTFDYDGKIGIGTTSPGAKLEISGSSNSALLNIKSPISGAILYVSGSGAVGIGDSNVGTYRLYVSGSFGATTKSFIIDHPTKAGKKLIYGSLESPYHGIRLTGRDTLVNGKCKVELPEYIYKLILHDSVNIQLTGIKCNKTLYVDEINIPENYFTIAYDKAIFESYKDYDFFWDFTAIRADVPELNTEL